MTHPSAHPAASARHGAHTPLGLGGALGVLGGYIAGQFTSSFFAGIVVGFMAAIQGESPTESDAFERALPLFVSASAIGGAAVAIALSYVFVYVRGGGTFRETVRWRLGRRSHVVLAAVTGAAMAVVYLRGVVALFPPDEATEWGPLVRMAQTPGAPRIVWAFLGLLVAPPLEEFLFRGVVFTGFARRLGVWGAAAVTTALFCAMHLPEVRHYWPGLIGIAALGALTMLARIRTRALGPGVAMHGAYNGIIVLAAVFSPAGV